MSSPSPALGQPPREGAAFLAGALTMLVLLLIPVVFLSLQIGPSVVAYKTRRALELATGRQKVLDMPADVRREIDRLGGVIEFGNPWEEIRARPHDTILTRPDPSLGWALRPGARIRCYTLRAANPVNLNPPLLHLPADAVLPPAVESYVESQGRLRYVYTVDARGLRVTVPDVASERRILMVGDSVLFGVGVDDGETMASHLQRILGDSVRVVNAGVGGYNGPQIVEAVRVRASEEAYESLVYVACQNDFMEEGRGPYIEQARRTFRGIAALRGRFPRGTTVLLVTTIEYALYDVLQDGGGWPAPMIEGSEALRRDLPGIAVGLGFRYDDLTDRVSRYALERGSLFARFALYADHVHLSPEGNRLAAERIAVLLGSAETAGRDHPVLPGRNASPATAR